jgi:hypothetical protein
MHEDDAIHLNRVSVWIFSQAQSILYINPLLSLSASSTSNETTRFQRRAFFFLLHASHLLSFCAPQNSAARVI